MTNLEKPWQLALETAWECHLEDFYPIAAVITDNNGEVISIGRRRGEKGLIRNTAMAHAEMDALLQLRYEDHPSIRKYTIYTTLEPCPMCMGSIVMSNLRNVCIAAKDPYAGATHLCEKDPYIAGKNMNVTFADEIIGQVYNVFLFWRELVTYGNDLRPNTIHTAKVFPREFAAAKEIFAGDAMADFVRKKVSFCEVYEYIKGGFKNVQI
ncbi:MAG: nucleoside deaminase [Defluviitaleaceae bacterium]|nr:nucleoside deaminase [Defluviitaleaceae bacterium]